MQRWLFPCNVNLYDPFGAFNELHVIDWRQNVKIKVGDEVFIYCSKPFQKIMFKTVAVKVNIPDSEVDQSDLRFNKNPEGIGDNPPRFGYARLQLVAFGDKTELSLPEIVKHGIVKAPQGQMKVSDELYEYLLKYL